MKLNPTPGPINARINNTMISTQASGTTSGQLFVTNYRTKSQSFQLMNQLVIRLDNTYKGLTSAQALSWQTGAVNYTGSKVCGCENQIINGQKLFRLCNYMLTIVNNAIDLSYMGFLGIAPFASIDVTISQSLGIFLVNYTGINSTSVIIFQVGQGLQNQVIKNETGSTPQGFFFDPANPPFIATIADGSTSNACVWYGTGSWANVYSVTYHQV